MNIWMKLLEITIPSIENVNRHSTRRTARSRVAVHVAEGIDVDRAAHARDDQQHQQAECVGRDAELDLQIADVSQLTAARRQALPLM